MFLLGMKCELYDYMLFVQEIPGTACMKFECTSSDSGTEGKTSVNTHGLWPEDLNGSYPTSCGSLSTDEYEDNKIENSLLIELNANWNGLYSNRLLTLFIIYN